MLAGLAIGDILVRKAGGGRGHEAIRGIPVVGTLNEGRVRAPECPTLAEKADFIRGISNERKMNMQWMSFCVAVTAMLGAVGCGPRERSKNFGWEWIRSRPFTITALAQTPAAVDMDVYKGAGMNVLQAWKHREGLQQKANEADMPWILHAITKVHSRDPSIFKQQKESTQRLVSTYPGCDALLIGDETGPPYAKAILGPQFEWARRTFPDKMLYSSLYCAGKDYGTIEGAEPPEKHTYATYLDTMIRLTKMDLVSFCAYPIEYTWAKALLHERWFKSLEEVRAAAQRAGIPYWCFIQAMDYGKKRDKYRYPSESELRLLVYTSLTYGYTGLQYFLWRGQADRNWHAIVHEDGTPDAIYPHIAAVNPEVARLGRALRMLKSTRVRYLSQRAEVARGTRRFEDGDGAPCRIRDVTFETPRSTSEGLLGLFEDDAGEAYFMLTNLQHTPTGSARETALTFTLHFEPGVKTVYRLSRTTGEVEAMPVVDGKLELSLPGGTGDLFKIADGDFPGL